MQVWDAGRFEEITLAGMIAAAPASVLTETFRGVPEATLDRMRRKPG